ncbi:MAG TPA: type II toxin-antitoxin system PemK/MazF family toxin [Terriglobia bacterium]|nr:type II toxin-antitoxin system PemK/MazF family toxin [Terriglobia bacterium]
MAKISPPHQKPKITHITRGEIHLVSFDPTVGHEIKKTRPALVIQNDIGNRYSPLTIVAAITSKVSPVPYPVEVIIEPTRECSAGLFSWSAAFHAHRRPCPPSGTTHWRLARPRLKC